MNFPNMLTLSRVFLTCILGATAQWPGLSGALTMLGVFSLATLTDFLDGYIARKYNLITPFGKIMDPIADKCLILTAMFIVSFEGIILVWMVMLVALREIGVTASRIYALTRGQVIPAEKEGKIKTVFQMLTILVVLFYRVFAAWPITAVWVRNQEIPLAVLINLLMIIAMVLTVTSGLAYFRNLRPGKES